MKKTIGAVLVLTLLAGPGCDGGGTAIPVDAPQGDADVSRTTDSGEPDSPGVPDRAVAETSPELMFDLPDLSFEGLSPECQPGEGCFLDKCLENSDCQSGWCVEHMGEGVCTRTCQDECPAGWKCKQLAATDPDVVYICVSNHSNLCKPCAGGDNCKSIGGADDVCIDYGEEGSFCGGPCKTDEDCPWGFGCTDVETVDGVILSQCFAIAGVCPCSDKSVQLGLFTPCAVMNDWGICEGKRVCTEDGLTKCDAPEPAEEACNGQDDNCDGDEDEATFVGGKYIDLCSDDNECTEDTCLGEAGCDFVALNGIECKDGNPCTMADHCEEGICIGTTVDCDDENPCTDDACNDTGGCEFTANSEECDDENPCTVADQCVDEECVGYWVDCDCQEDDDCQQLEDGNLCNGTLYCAVDKLPYQCAVVPESVLVCPEPEGVDAACLAPVCEPNTGECSFAAANDGAACEDGDKCTLGDSCQDGVCSPGLDANCNDGNPCTDDSCEPLAGCTNQSNDLPCNDDDVCTTNDTCAEGVCFGEGELKCDDGNPCTDDSCDPGVGCLQTANETECDDSNMCTVLDLCLDTVCVGSGSLDCGDGNQCTDDICLSEVGCTHLDIDGGCSDGNPCTLNDYCVAGACVAGALVDCDDGNPCTDDSCGDEGLCIHSANQAECDDGDKCTTGDHCGGSLCLTTGTLDCDDDEICTTDYCDPELGCMSEVNSVPCDDEDVCTYGEHCNLGECVPAGELTCEDNNPCTDDSCDPQAGCQFVPNDGDCSDNNACTDGDYCEGGGCQPGPLIYCDEANPCTDDSCDVGTGCIHVPNVKQCDDGNECTVGEMCANGVCTGGEEPACDDGNLCTDDSCDALVGCVYVDNLVPCDDLNACTEQDACTAGICVPGEVVICDDKNSCTSDSCDPAQGCVFAHLAGSCDDGDACTQNDTCIDGICTPGDPTVCNDGNVCTDDSCEPDSGCVFLSNDGGCDDDDACTEGDHCQGGLCLPGDPVVCDDGNTCTTDSCSPQNGCVYVPVADGTDCGGGKTCLNGDCVDCPNPHGTQTFNYSGNKQTFQIPTCVNKVTIEAWGAQGGGSNGGEDGGKGGYAKGDLQVNPGSVLNIYVGEKGKNQSSGGWNGGGHGAQYGGGGGGASDVRVGGTSLNDRKLVAGAGAGGQTGGPDHGSGGHGGGLTGGAGTSNFGWTTGKGGTQNAGGAAGSQCHPGTFGNGGSKASYHVSGGGGGWYGGGCSYGAGGGGGSSYYGGCDNGSTQTGVKTGNGMVKLTW